ncbi:MAG TPA: hypothetical protein VJZ26_05265 [Blastocatellia bacterium]|nr:hypothetical protein [Blastocatellia bacterium]
MQGHYEYKSIRSTPFGLQKLGDEGWEVVEARTTLDAYIEFTLRRPADASSRPSWEYHQFRDVGAPEPDWKNHLSSCGWTILLHIREYMSASYLAMRSESWRGTDDGDIIARLQDLGCSLFWSASYKIGQILSIKWTESVKRGYNIGTYEAVRYWLAHKAVPELLESKGLSMPEESPEAVLDELLSLRAALKGDYYSPRLEMEDVIERWRAFKS